MEFKKIQGIQVPVSAIIENGCKVGNGTKIWHFSHIMPTAVIGENCIIGDHCFIAGVVGDNCKIQNGVSIFQGVHLADNVFVGPNAVFSNVLSPRVHIEQKNYHNTFVREGVSIGAGAVIVCGNTIFRYAFIGAGSLVSKDVMPYSKTFGNPAKHWGWVCKNGCNMRSRDSACPTCGVTND